jgi:hypothetical protein
VGNYNPHTPYILGEEWVPIRQPGLLPNDITERGYVTSIDQQAVVVTGAYYVLNPPPSTTASVGELLAVYPYGQEDDTGPIHQVVIPCDAVTVTGSGMGGNPSVAASTLADPSDGEFIVFTPPVGGGSQQMGLSFDVFTYSQALFGKRILNVEFIYTASGTQFDLSQTNVIIGRASNLSNGQVFYSKLSGSTSTSVSNSTQIESTSFGELNVFHTSTVVSPGVPFEPYAYPWRYNELSLLDGSATPLNQKLIVVIQNQGNTDNIIIGYAALRVTYCEEKRVAYGAARITSVPPNAFNEGFHFVPMRTPAFAAGVTLAPGSYSVVVAHDQLGANPGPFPPNLMALQELYELPSLQGMQINRSLTVDTTFTSEYTDVIPKLTLHTATAVVTGSHPYGVQLQAPVAGTTTALQDIGTNPAGFTGTYPWIRFYARKFGDTLTDLEVLVGAATARISVADFDELPEIINGWKEVTLRLDSAVPVTGGVTALTVTWSAPNENFGTLWQILGARTRPPHYTNDTPQSIIAATYFAPQGGTIELTWQSPMISGVAQDVTADAVAILSQDPPTVTGFGVATAFQEVAQVGLNCGTPNGCIPTGIGFNELTWDMGVVCDDFGRVESAEWGDSTTDQPWETSGGVASSFDVDGSEGTITSDTVSTEHLALINMTHTDFDITTDIGVPDNNGTAQHRLHVIGRATDINNFYAMRFEFQTTGVVALRLEKRVAGVTTSLADNAAFATHLSDEVWHVRMRGIGTNLYGKAWVGDDEPLAWSHQAVDTSLTTGTNAGVIAWSTEVMTFSYDNFYAVRPDLYDSWYQIDRYDSIDDAWNTIVLTDNMCVNTFGDYEARVGVESLYRIQVRNPLDFAGPWASGSGTIPAPGVVIPGDGNSVLIFTSNVGPTGNLAYTMTWENRPIETYIFPEADAVQLQRIYGKNFMTAFRPLERGGERFQRTILVNAAAIALPSLANFKSLRNLAWADLPYVCVRDELGNRWYATVIVPSGNVSVDRQLYLAQIDVIETSETPFAVDPA